ncbi:hypothetical protein EKJ_23910 [Qipengyuania flava]|uniref:Uncharacterized protein n=1 Tax=Qipengyuania flava TaxID=192812 RepID=A0A3T1CKL8_9SPHN|nr:hypothetical protein EKJ_23910 [Qipengyuania flava]
MTGYGGRNVAKQNTIALAEARNDGSGLAASAAAGPHAIAMDDHAKAIYIPGIRYVELVNDSICGELAKRRFGDSSATFSCSEIPWLTVSGVVHDLSLQ